MLKCFFLNNKVEELRKFIDYPKIIKLNGISNAKKTVTGSFPVYPILGNRNV